MGRRSTMDFLQALEKLNDKDHLFYKIRYCAAPTIAGIKPSSLMAFTDLKRCSYVLWERYKDDTCTRLGVEYYELKHQKDRVFVLFYKDKDLAKCLFESEKSKFLLGLGYKKTKVVEDYLDTLKKRYEMGCPHELGVFLGYPLNDVIAFIENKGEPCLANKYWKVYQNVEKALLTFDAYDEEREKVIRAVFRLT